MTTHGNFKIMIIDDHPAIISGVKALLALDSRFIVVGEFLETRSIINWNGSSPDLVILDLGLRGLNGEQSLPVLKRKFPNCKVVAYTQIPGRSKRLKELGFDGYVQKADVEPLTDVLLAVLNGEKYFSQDDKQDPTNASLTNEILSKRERSVARRMLRFFSSKQIGEELSIAEVTVETHRKHIKQKLGAKSKSELFDMLKEMGLDQPGDDDE